MPVRGRPRAVLTARHPAGGATGPDSSTIAGGLFRGGTGAAGASVAQLAPEVLRALDDEDEQLWTAPPSRRQCLLAIAEALPTRIHAVLADQIYVPPEDLPSGLVNRLVRLAAFQNPAFYTVQAMRRSTFGTPRIIACAELLSHHVALPRGCLAALEHLLKEFGSGIALRDERVTGRRVEHTFLAVNVDRGRGSIYSIGDLYGENFAPPMRASLHRRIGPPPRNAPKPSRRSCGRIHTGVMGRLRGVQ